MVDAPKKIWATINGASTRLPDGTRQLIGGWSQDSERPNGTEYTRSDLVAKLTAENERMKHDGFLARVAGYFDASELAGSFLSEDGDGGFLAAIHGMTKEIERLRAESLASTGALKVKPLEWTKLSTGWISHTSFHAYEVVATANGFMATYANLDFAWGEEETMKLAAQADYERRILFALDTHPRDTNTVDAHETANVSDKPEGQQEPVAWMWEEVVDQTGDVIRGGTITRFATHWSTPPSYAVVTPLYTRPSEQAVTEAGIEAAARHITKWLGFAWDGLHDGRVAEKGFPIFTHGQFGWGFQGHKGDMIDLARIALKAAMEAGG